MSTFNVKSSSNPIKRKNYEFIFGIKTFASTNKKFGANLIFYFHKIQSQIYAANKKIEKIVCLAIFQKCQNAGRKFRLASTLADNNLIDGYNFPTQICVLLCLIHITELCG